MSDIQCLVIFELEKLYLTGKVAEAISPKLLSHVVLGTLGPVSMYSIRSVQPAAGRNAC